MRHARKPLKEVEERNKVALAALDAKCGFTHEPQNSQNKSTFTPGPWTLHPRVAEDPPHIYYEGCIVATVDTSAPDPGERQANARLIAAAPEMFAALEWASRSTHHPTCKVAKGKGIYCNCHVAACQAVITKIKQG